MIAIIRQCIHRRNSNNRRTNKPHLNNFTVFFHPHNKPGQAKSQKNADKNKDDHKIFLRSIKPGAVAAALPGYSAMITEQINNSIL
jgi:hypothetical protein